MAEAHVSSKVTLPYLNPTVVQEEATAVLAFLKPIIAWIPGQVGNTILAVVTALATNPAIVTAVCDAINAISGAAPPAA